MDFNITDWAGMADKRLSNNEYWCFQAVHGMRGGQTIPKIKC